MRLKKAQEYIEKALPVLVKHIREKYLPDFVAPEVEFDNTKYLRFGEYDPSYRIIRIRVKGGTCSESLVHTLTHELGHALLDQVNPELYEIDYSRDSNYYCLSEGIAEVLEEEWAELLKKQGLVSYSFLYNWIVSGVIKHYPKWKKAVEKLRKGKSLVEIMKQAHDPHFAYSVMER